MVEDLLKLLIEDLHLNIYFKFQEKLIGRDNRIYKFQIRKEEKTQMSNNNKSTLLHHKRETKDQQSKYIYE